LGLQPRAASPDDVHVVFELAKSADPTLLVAGTRLDAGKDVNGHPLAYATQNELVVSAATVSGTARAGDGYPTSVVKKAHAAARENIRVRIVIGSYAPGPRRLTPR